MFLPLFSDGFNYKLKSWIFQNEKHFFLGWHLIFPLSKEFIWFVIRGTSRNICGCLGMQVEPMVHHFVICFGILLINKKD